MAVNRNSRAWAAGLFDGEGCCCLVHDKRGKRSTAPLLQIAQNHLEVLERFKVATGGQHRIYGPYGKAGMYSYRIYGPGPVIRTARLLWPWLGTVKREQILHVLRSKEGWIR